MSKLFPNYNQPGESLSEFMPKETTRVFASEHTLRMLDAGLFDRETEKALRETGLRGYLWGLAFYADETLPHGIFRYESEDKIIGELRFTGTNPDGFFVSASGPKLM